MKFLVWVLAWFFFILGSITHAILRGFDKYLIWCFIWYPVYNRFMLISLNLQDYADGRSSRWPWQ